jgi:hypothetical protein
MVWETIRSPIVERLPRPPAPIRQRGSFSPEARNEMNHASGFSVRISAGTRGLRPFFWNLLDSFAPTTYHPQVLLF